jgi:hypothetical protein
MNIGVALRNRITEKSCDMENAIACHNTPLEVRTTEATPIDLAWTQLNFGNALKDRGFGEKSRIWKKRLLHIGLLLRF